MQKPWLEPDAWIPGRKVYLNGCDMPVENYERLDGYAQFVDKVSVMRICNVMANIKPVCYVFIFCSSVE